MSRFLFMVVLFSAVVLGQSNFIEYTSVYSVHSARSNALANSVMADKSYSDFELNPAILGFKNQSVLSGGYRDFDFHVKGYLLKSVFSTNYGNFGVSFCINEGRNLFLQNYPNGVTDGFDNATDLSINLAYGFLISENLAIGANLMYFSSNTENTEKIFGISFGLLYQLEDYWDIGISLLNQTFTEFYSSYDIPVFLNIGSSIRLFEEKSIGLNIYNSLHIYLNKNEDLFSLVDKTLQVRNGVSLLVGEFIKVRCGVDNDTIDDSLKVSYGIGFSFNYQENKLIDFDFSSSKLSDKRDQINLNLSIQI